MGTEPDVLQDSCLSVLPAQLVIDNASPPHQILIITCPHRLISMVESIVPSAFWGLDIPFCI